MKSDKERWNCRCDCGNEIETNKPNVTSGGTRSCGCLNIEMTIERETVHGHCRGGKSSREYSSWQAMHTRCTNPNDKNYKHYGGRGIIVCERWNSFECFLSDLGPKPSVKHEIDRIDNDGHYEPGNCRWTTRVEQQNNKRTNRRVAAFGRIRTLARWARECGIKYTIARRRLERGWSAERALTK
jgi:hypothetical protein